MSAQYTPGQWAIDWNISRLDIHTGSTMVVSVRRPALDDGEAIANARLIAAAPDLLAELQKAADTYADTKRYFSMLRKPEPAEAFAAAERSARAAIAKALGESA